MQIYVVAKILNKFGDKVSTGRHVPTVFDLYKAWPEITRIGAYSLQRLALERQDQGETKLKRLPFYRCVDRLNCEVILAEAVCGLRFCF